MRLGIRVPRRAWWIYAGIAVSVPTLFVSALLVYYYIVLAGMIDARMQGERVRSFPHVFARPFELGRGQALGERQLVERLNDLGYAQRTRPEHPGEFAIGRGTVVLIPRAGDAVNRMVRVSFRRRPGAGAAADRIEALEVTGRGPADRLRLDAPMITALVTGQREKRRKVALEQIPPHLVRAVLAIEDRRFYEHPGVDIVRSIGALVTNIRGDRPYLVGGSTLTQQLVKNLLLTREKTLRRKLLEQFMALILERRLSKDEILELYLNEVYLGQRGSFAIHGVAEAARLFFAKDVMNLTLGEAATMAGVIQSPSVYSPFRARERARDRRNVVLHAMAEEGFISQEAALRAAREPLVASMRGLDSEAPYFADFVGQALDEQFAGWSRETGGVDVHTTVDLHLQRLAHDAVRDGLARVDDLLAKRRRVRRSEAALVAVDPRTGDILALVGGRAYTQSQYNRAVAARRQPGSVFKPFVYLAAFERALAEGRTDLTPATLIVDEPTTFAFEEQVWNPHNYQEEYDGPITLRRALALSRNVAAVKVAEAAGYDRVAALWRRVGTSTPPRPYPSIALGVFEATPLEVATAYTAFANMGRLQPLRAIDRVTSGGRVVFRPRGRGARRVSSAETAFLVTNMMRSVLNEGTGASARAAGFTLDAAGKSGTTNDLRDAWFVGFTPELLTAVWVGFDDNQPLGLSGTQAALPIWTAFMMRALAGRADRPFDPPDGISFLEIDRDTGSAATPGCPRVFQEAFIAGTEPFTVCDLHRF
jgi:penicillin-binding protein 1B